MYQPAAHAGRCREPDPSLLPLPTPRSHSCSSRCRLSLGKALLAAARAPSIKLNHNPHRPSPDPSDPSDPLAAFPPSKLPPPRPAPGPGPGPGPGAAGACERERVALLELQRALPGLLLGAGAGAESNVSPH